MPKSLVGILMGSQSDQSVMAKAGEILSELGIPSETLVMSAHRQPELVSDYAAAAAGKGIKV
ncbi:MAG: AIR carboxylase family protein, partial [Actinomycetota bacterium]